MTTFLNTLFRAAPLCLPLLSGAQVPGAHPSDAGGGATSLRYRSAFEGYRPWQDVEPADWRALNDALRDGKPPAHDPADETQDDLGHAEGHSGDGERHPGHAEGHLGHVQDGGDASSPHDPPRASEERASPVKGSDPHRHGSAR